ncbi:MAG: 2-oxoglutarate synthase subunit alpha [Armatimonadetes bacterium CG_4_10_14_3_um_filter_66_18]|nr:2-oxoacid:acceptor oxidoreductase subunit alpha [Armatimonadota bacterium]OIO91612.1 MAG: 2-oxoglutarate synthase subunit alpha [Armatimonadetes bacterium CG2_30_66_41]PIU89747.1 MAG: 2-oxoglutarate synthase subunit alpha [Armatimonadetes bacterium CG06_land_8_20_14_3_00_66_21]PIX48102.1 MAG: 2-oxoglutarate synthase subunit alpha [Armatimonadetes bacterium CG_4_8_14_3_um_filter_66_20]PIY35254.1 MAG: 2-oxoglutarate synthase subunit alpha [Armatimonadetes bacterium CG_4_10_14_3_um_filter_66_18
MSTNRAVLTGEHFLLGDYAAAEGAMAAGCMFFGGYPITPATEVAERMAERLPEVGGVYMQMEDEIASMAAILGASWGGAKSMTGTSGPGFSLMMENLGLGLITETPCVVVNIQRAAPSTGLPTLVGQGDMMQARWGSHGPYEIIALTPSSPQELFDLTLRAFNLSEKYRLPVLVMGDAEVGHMTEKVVIPPPDEIELIERKPPPEDRAAFKTCLPDADLVPPMARAGDGYHVFVESLTHDDRGYPVLNAETHEAMVRRLHDKILLHKEDIVDFEERYLDGCDIVILAYGISARIAAKSLDLARAKGLKVGMLRLIVAWPFPEDAVRELSKRIQGFVVPEINYGQMSREVERCSRSDCLVELIPRAGGEIHTPEEILAGIERVARA